MIEVITSGPFSTIQDLGRFGFQHLGVPISGALDRNALIIGNQSLGNDRTKSAIEICFGGFSAKAEQAFHICVTGSISALVKVTSKSGIETIYEAGTIVPVEIDDVIEVPPFGDSLSCLLCITGGFDVPVIYGSSATTTNAGLGGFEGRILQSGDRLNIGTQPHKIAQAIRHLNKQAYQQAMQKPQTLRLILGPQDFWFTSQALETLTKAPYQISPQTSRMGMRLSGARLAHKGPADILSDAMVRGALQVPADGQPILAMADHGTMGGYTKIAVVISADIAAMGRLRPRDEIQFAIVTPDEAQQALKDERELLAACVC